MRFFTLRNSYISLFVPISYLFIVILGIIGGTVTFPYIAGLSMVTLLFVSPYIGYLSIGIAFFQIVKRKLFLGPLLGIVLNIILLIMYFILSGALMES